MNQTPTVPVSRQAFDLGQLAENGLKRGYTTGTCATAAVKAALLHLLCKESPPEVNVSLPDGVHFITVPIESVTCDGTHSAVASVIKNGGDDPDQTHGARIHARVTRNSCGQIVFKRGNGVGIVTQPGMQIPVGEPAINPTPRRMMMNAVREILDEGDGLHDEGFDLEIGCEGGEEIAKRTFNPRLGIQGGISILGTSGIVEPKSMAAFQASIEIYIRVALGDNPEEIVIAPGNLGQRFARTSLQLPLKRVVQMSNFIGFALECIERLLTENKHTLPKLWVIGHPGKIAKVLDDIWDTHSHRSHSAIQPVHRLAKEFGMPAGLLKRIETANTVEGVIELLAPEQIAPQFWQVVEQEIATAVSNKLKSVNQVVVKLFQMDGTPLGGKTE
jgi:cobalt-precorrin-5B (C1)-methyltransferase